MSDKPTSNIKLNGEQNESFSSKGQKKTTMPTLTFIQVSVGSLSQSNWARKRNKKHPNWKEKSKTITICR